MKRLAFLALAACGGGSTSTVVEIPPQDLPQPQATVQVAASQPQPAAPATALVRPGEDWFGRYVCAQGETDLDLRIENVTADSVEATFIFAHGPSGAAGSYRMRGTISPSGRMRLVPSAWIQRPPNYVMVGMSGELRGDTFSGRIDDPSCSEFVVRRR